MGWSPAAIRMTCRRSATRSWKNSPRAGAGSKAAAYKAAWVRPGTLVQYPAIALLILPSSLAARVVLSRITRIPYPIVLVAGGILLGVLPGVPNVELSPNIILLLVLPPLVFYAALVYQGRRLQENATSISFLAIGLLIATMAGVALVAHSFAGLPWGAAFVLGAILSPTDPVTATVIASRLGAPRRVTGVIEGESLVNDGVALVIYGTAVSAVYSGDYSTGFAALMLPATILGGIAIGLLVAWLVSWVLLRRLGSGYHIIVLALLTAYVAYLSAYAVGASGVLAAVAAGIYIGRRMPVDDTPADRIAAYSFFEVMVFLINAVVFILMGLQFPRIIERISARPPVTLLLWAVAVNLTVIALRMAWCMAFDQMLFRLRPNRKRYGDRPWRQSVVIGWAGMRGAVSLAAALGVPMSLAGGSPFPGRDPILFLTITVILVTVIFQGLSLPALIRLLRLGRDTSARGEIRRARRLGARAALEQIEKLREEKWLPDEAAELLRGLYVNRAYALAQRSGDGD